MTILLVAHTKGGAVKTTTALNLAVMRGLAGRRVALVDADVGLSLSTWLEKRDKLGISEPDFYPAKAFGKLAHKSVEKLAAHYDDVIVDAGGEGDGAPEIRLILGVANKVLTPCRTPEGDTVRLEAIHRLVAGEQQYNKQLDAMLFAVAASTNVNSSDVVKFYNNVAQFSSYRILDAVLRDRVAYRNWQETGQAVVEAKRPDQLAVAELNQLYAEVFHDDN